MQHLYPTHKYDLRDPQAVKWERITRNIISTTQDREDAFVMRIWTKNRDMKPYNEGTPNPEWTIRAHQMYLAFRGLEALDFDYD